ncbi:hypothetical protein CRE_28477 [Caenorhabditis remanei]|uniref:Exonuclease domain-containing protein n=1 Tax=Caenorhabditis remanei TaxID=31234 RepID=E3LMN4_CAERE|nr:hypothetical protein CRE_28477 [Caenorhabditis remanei]
MMYFNPAVQDYSNILQTGMVAGISADNACQEAVYLLQNKAYIENLILQKTQLFEHGFPMDMGSQVYIQPSPFQRGEMFYSENDSSRFCTRCRSTFHVELSGLQRTSSTPICKDSDGIFYNFHIHTQESIESLKSFKKAPRANQFNWHMPGKMFALDVESVYTSHGQEVGRVTVVDHLGETVIDAILHPRYQVYDCVTKYSGLTPELFLYATETLESVRERIFDVINEESILVGHGLNGDLKALRIIHSNVIDTSILYDNNGKRPSLQQLTSTHLNYQIQNAIGGHCSKEDAVASLQLVYFGAMNPHQLSPYFRNSYSFL